MVTLLCAFLAPASNLPPPPKEIPRQEIVALLAEDETERVYKICFAKAVGENPAIDKRQTRTSLAYQKSAKPADNAKRSGTRHK